MESRKEAITVNTCPGLASENDKQSIPGRYSRFLRLKVNI